MKRIRIIAEWIGIAFVWLVLLGACATWLVVVYRAASIVIADLRGPFAVAQITSPLLYLVLCGAFPVYMGDTVKQTLKSTVQSFKTLRKSWTDTGH